MISADARFNVFFGGFSAQTRRMTVYGFVERFGPLNFHHYFGVFVQYPGKIHHFSQITNLFQCQQLPHFFNRNSRACRLKRSSRNAGRSSKAKFKRHPFSILNHVLYAFDTQHIPNLVRVRHGCNSTMYYRQTCKLCRCQHGTFNVDVCIYKTGHYVRSPYFFRSQNIYIDNSLVFNFNFGVSNDVVKHIEKIG